MTPSFYALVCDRLAPRCGACSAEGFRQYVSCRNPSTWTRSGRRGVRRLQSFAVNEILLVLVGVVIVVTFAQRKAELSALRGRRLEQHRDEGILVDAEWVQAHLGDWPLAIDYNGELWLAKIGASILGNDIDPSRARRVNPKDENSVKSLLEAEGRRIAVQLQIQ